MFTPSKEINSLIGVWCSNPRPHSSPERKCFIFIENKISIHFPFWDNHKQIQCFQCWAGISKHPSRWAKMHITLVLGQKLFWKVLAKGWDCTRSPWICQNPKLRWLVFLLSSDRGGRYYWKNYRSPIYRLFSSYRQIINNKKIEEKKDLGFIEKLSISKICIQFHVIRSVPKQE